MQFCPNCGAQRTGAFRFCRSCKFDFDTDTMSSAPPSGAPSSTGPSEAADDASPRGLPSCSGVVTGTHGYYLYALFAPYEASDLLNPSKTN